MKRFLLLFPILVVCFDFLFWHQTPGLNIFLFTILVLAMVFWRFQKSRSNKTTLILAAGSLLSAFMVFYHGAGWALFSTVLSLTLFTTSAAFQENRSAFAIFFQSFLTVMLAPITFGDGVFRSTENKRRFGRIGFYLGITVIPLLVVLFFYLMYLLGSPHFRNANSGVLTWLAETFEDFSWGRFLFIVAGGWAATVFLRRCIIDAGISKSEKFLVRSRQSTGTFSNLALKKENIAGVILLVMLNALIAVVNYIDVRTVWFTFEVPENFSLKQFVHDGTWILSVCVIFSMFIVLRFFRGNQNFYGKAKWLKRFAVLWVVQNIVLVVSVYMRNHYYIGWHGLAYGRIAVIVFLVLVLVALFLMIMKIHRRYSTGYFLTVNSWVIYVAIFLCSFINWDVVIMKHNLAHRNISQIDFDFYQRVSGDLYPEVYRNRETINKQIVAHNTLLHRWVYWSSPEQYWIFMQNKRSTYFRTLISQDWQSWTISGRNAIDELRRPVFEYGAPGGLYENPYSDDDD
ncbi:MAG TPA: DUF4173 domain-containing protein [Bacteroidia bacterium]|nr:DUF4173 domain-containing protein [Bacteroidia bacterium]